MGRLFTPDGLRKKIFLRLLTTLFLVNDLWWCNTLFAELKMFSLKTRFYVVYGGSLGERGCSCSVGPAIPAVPTDCETGLSYLPTADGAVGRGLRDYFLLHMQRYIAEQVCFVFIFPFSRGPFLRSLILYRRMGKNTNDSTI